MTDDRAVARIDELDGKTLLALITTGDMGGLDPERKVAYYKTRCEAAGLDPRTAPFQFVKLQGKETLYATKAATDQLTKVHKISVEVLEQKTEGDIRVVMVRAKTGDGRETDEMGAVPVLGLKGPDLANAYMKAITKAKRRAVLSLCGLGMMDETDLETVHGVAPAPVVRMPQPTGPAEPEFTEAVPMDQEPSAPAVAPATETPEVVGRKVIITPVKIIPEKNPAGGFIYSVYDTAGTIYTLHSKSDALVIKESIEKQLAFGAIVEGKAIKSLEVPF